MPKLSETNQELEKLGNFLEEYIKVMKEKVSHYDESESEKKQKLEEKIEKVQSYLDKIRVPESRNFIKLGKPKKYWGSTEGWKEPICERYGFKFECDGDNKSITLDIIKELSDELNLNSEEEFYMAEEILKEVSKWKEVEGGITIESKDKIFLQSNLVEEETNKGKIVGTFSGIGAGAASGAAVGAGAMVALSPWTFGLSLSLVPAASIFGAITGSLGGGATGLVAGSISDKISNSKAVEIKSEIKGFFEDYKTMMEKESQGCQDIISHESSTAEEKEESQKQKEHYDNEVRELEAYIESSNNWK